MQVYDTCFYVWIGSIHHNAFVVVAFNIIKPPLTIRGYDMYDVIHVVLLYYTYLHAPVCCITMVLLWGGGGLLKAAVAKVVFEYLELYHRWQSVTYAHFPATN